jgi:hypothetical protein
MTDFPAILAGLGFADASVVSQRSNTLVVRVWTDKGWAYERFNKDASADDVAAWAKDKVPGI